MKLLTYARITFGRACQGRRGQSLVEFAMVAPLFFLLVFGITDFGRLFFTQQTLQFALREAGRYAVTGQHQYIDPNDHSAGTYSRVQSIRNVAQQYAMGLLSDPSAIQISSGSTTNYAGGPGETVVVSLTTDLKLITPFIGNFFGPNGDYRFTVSTTFKNEPFDLGDAK
ncbi:MAG TPA: TadE/TadG family type IV pilus assembly protein [Verrucomicrobiae bacterium]|nr:TadE/TadG family type IV pilus assembly protein [Verrucomicrobiae bacterium]